MNHPRYAFQTDRTEAMKSLIHSLILLALLVLSADKTFAIDYHLTPSSNLQSVLYSLRPGDNVYLAAGNYYPPIAEAPYNNLGISGINGTPTSWITVKNEPGTRPCIYFNANIYNGLNINNSTYIHIEGLELVGNSNDTGAFGICVAGSSHHIQLVKNVIHNFGGNGIGGSASQYLIEGNVCYNNCKRAHWGPSGISVWEPMMQNTNNTDFGGPLGNPGNAYSIIIRNNTCYDNVETYANPATNSITDGHGIICDDFQHTQSPGSPFIGKTLICNNLCYNNGGRGIELYLSDKVDVFNNTVYQNLGNLNGDGELGNDGNTNRFFNNISWPSTGHVGSETGQSGASDGGTWSNNLYCNTNLYVLGTNDLTGLNPQFVNPNTNSAVADFHLTAASPAIGRGTTSANLAVDHDSAARTGRNDIGAYQLQGTVIAVPIFSRIPGTYPISATVAMSSATSGASIRYTTNGSTPTSTNGTLYTGQVTLATTTTLKAIAYNGTISSTMTSGTYTITPYRINVGGSAVAPFNADNYYNSGTVSTVTTEVTTTGVTNAAPAAVYQSDRWGAMTYTFPNLVVGHTYTVRLHFAEVYFGTGNPGGGGVGSRKFNVSLNGTQVLTNFDILSIAGAPNKANVQKFTITPTSSGQIVINFTAGSANYPKCCAIEILP